MSDAKNRLDERKQSGAKSFTFSANPTFIEEARSAIGGSFSQAVVAGLEIVLERSRKGEPIRVPHKLGSLMETLEFDGRWVVAPEESQEHVMTTRFHPGDLSEMIGHDYDSDSSATRELKPKRDPQNDVETLVEDRTWWAAALTATRSFIWFRAKSRVGFATGEIEYYIQKEGELTWNSFNPVPQDIYDTVRQKASTMLRPRRIG